MDNSTATDVELSELVRYCTDRARSEFATVILPPDIIARVAMELQERRRAPQFNFDDVMYGVRRHEPFKGETLADNTPDDVVHALEEEFKLVALMQMTSAERAELQAYRAASKNPIGYVDSRPAAHGGISWAANRLALDHGTKLYAAPPIQTVAVPDDVDSKLI